MLELEPSRANDVGTSSDLPWWPLTGMTTILMAAPCGLLYRVPDTPEDIPRDYDCALNLPYEAQQQILTSNGTSGFPTSPIDPKCIVVVRTTAGHGWFVRLSLSPQVLRRMPPHARERMLQTLRSDRCFCDSSLVTEYVDTGESLDPATRGWKLVDPAPTEGTESDEESVLASPAAATGTCVVCQTEAVSRLLVPCGHAALCARCSHRRPVWTRCPLCRSPVARLQLLFV